MKRKCFQQDIIIETEELTKIMIMGGLGVNYVGEKGRRDLRDIIVK
ncbi:hypothetical protein SD960_14155 [Flavobacterium sp. MMLR14_040]|nr:hypothetical protein [Flavobacterium sp. MMLR14_040]MDW8851244.1 hypothetical protein [Flavobacterium sp. MMLR14_040]